MSFNSETTRIVQVLTTTNQAVSLNGFYFQTDDQVSVVSVDADGIVTARSITTDYTLTGAGLSTYGTLTVVGGTVGDTWFVYRDVPITQLIGWVQQGGFSMRNLTIATDKAAMIDLQLQEQIDRAAKFPRTESSAVSAELPTLEQRKGNAAAWNSVTGEWEAIARSNVAPSDAGSITYTSASGDAGKDLGAKIQGLPIDVAAEYGTTDAAVQLAVAAWTTRGGVLQFSSTTYNTTTTINFPMFSEGTHEIEITSGATINYTGSGWAIDCGGTGQAYANVSIRGNGRIYCGGSALGAIKLTAFNRGRIEGLYVKGSGVGKGIYVNGANTIDIIGCDVRTFQQNLEGDGIVVSSVSYGAIAVNVIGGHISNATGWGIKLANSGAGESCQSWNIQTTFDPSGSNDANSGNIWIQQGVAIRVSSHMEYGPVQYGQCSIRIGDASNHPQSTVIQGCVIGSVNSTYSIEDYGVGTQMDGNAETAAVTAFCFSGSGSSSRIFGKNIALAAGASFAGTDAGDTLDIGNNANLANTIFPSAFGTQFKGLSGYGGPLLSRTSNAAYNANMLFQRYDGSEMGRISRNLRGAVALSSGTATVTFSAAEADADYFVQLTGSAAESFSWSSKGTSGFTITSSNVSSNATVDWMILR